MTFKQTLQDIKGDLSTSSFKIFLINYFYSPGFRVLLNHRIGKYLYQSKFIFFRQLAVHYKAKLITKRNCDISYNAVIGKNVKFPHPIGIVIGDYVIIGDNSKIWQQVTLGSHGRKGKKLEYPIIGKGVKIFAGAKIIGGISIGENSVIGANAVVNINVPCNSVAFGVPCKIK